MSDWITWLLAYWSYTWKGSGIVFCVPACPQRVKYNLGGVTIWLPRVPKYLILILLLQKWKCRIVMLFLSYLTYVSFRLNWSCIVRSVLCTPVRRRSIHNCILEAFKTFLTLKDVWIHCGKSVNRGIKTFSGTNIGER